jgi:membrane protease YdiL (CAAX protease family)
MVVLPHQQEPDISQVPFFTLLSWILMGAVVAGVAEEISFRGFMQRPIEQRYGPVTAILVTGVLFGFAHFGHPEVTLILMPYYVAVAAVYGLLAYFTDSIFPSMMLHAGGNMLGAFDLFTHGRSEWQTPAAPAPLIWDSGTDLSFWISCFFFLLAGVAATWAYINLARATRPLRLNLPDSPNLIITKK